MPQNSEDQFLIGDLGANGSGKGGWWDAVNLTLEKRERKSVIVGGKGRVGIISEIEKVACRCTYHR